MGSGQTRRMEERNETQSNLEETGELEYEVSVAGYGAIEEAKEEAEGNESSVCDQSTTEKESAEAANADAAIEHWAGETSSIVYSDDDSKGAQSQGESAGEESKKEEKTLKPYYLSDEDRAEVLARLVSLGESYGLTYYPEVTESETWDSPTPIYEEELILGREVIMNTMVEYTEGAFVLMKMEGCSGFALQIKEQPDTSTDAYYEVYVYWM